MNWLTSWCLTVATPWGEPGKLPLISSNCPVCLSLPFWHRSSSAPLCAFLAEGACLTLPFYSLLSVLQWFILETPVLISYQLLNNLLSWYMNALMWRALSTFSSIKLTPEAVISHISYYFTNVDYLQLDLFTTLKGLGFLGIFLVFVGHRTLSYLASTSAKLKSAWEN